MTSKHDQIAGALIQDILNAHYRVGERMPSERDLAARFDVNRGAVREAMKKLEQIGLVLIQPGGARVQATSEASLDVISHMLNEGDLPDQTLVDQILVVIGSLMRVAAEQTLELATDAEIENIQRLAKPLYQSTLDEQAHTLARFELFQSIMLTSRNLPLQLIARSLFEQFAPNVTQLHEHVQIDHSAYSSFAEQLDHALTDRNLPAVQAAFAALSSLNREYTLRAFEIAQQQIRQFTLSVG